MEKGSNPLAVRERIPSSNRELPCCDAVCVQPWTLHSPHEVSALSGLTVGEWESMGRVFDRQVRATLSRGASQGKQLAWTRLAIRSTTHCRFCLAVLSACFGPRS